MPQFLPQRWTRQPQYPVALRRDGIARSCVGMYAVLGSKPAFYSQTGVTFATSDTGANVVNAVGNGRSFSGSTVAVYPNASYKPPSQALSFVVCFSVTSYVDYSQVFSAGTAFNQAGIDLRIGSGPTSKDVLLTMMGPTAGTDVRAWNAGQSLATGYHTLCVQSDGVLTNSPIFSIDGAASVTGSASGTGTGNIAVSAGNVYIGGRSDAYTHFDGSVFALAMFNEILPMSELRSIAANPWQIFAPLPRKTHSYWTGGAYTLTAASGSYSLTGNAVVLPRTRINIAAAGTYTYTGNAAGLTKSAAAKTLTADAGTYNYTGQAAALRKGWDIIEVAGSYAMTGVAANLVWKRVITAAAGTYNYTGVAATLTKQWKLVAAAGSYAMTGNDAGLTYSGVAHQPLAAAAGSYAYTGNAANLLWNRVITAAAGSYIETGNAVTLTKQSKAVEAAGSYAYTGNAVNFPRSYVLIAGNGVYNYTGRSVNWNYSGNPGQAVEFLKMSDGISAGVSKISHNLTSTGGSNYLITEESTLSEDKKDSVHREGYIIT